MNVPSRSPFLQYVLADLAKQHYPKRRISLHIHAESETSAMHARNLAVVNSWIAQHEVAQMIRHRLLIA